MRRQGWPVYVFAVMTVGFAVIVGWVAVSAVRSTLSGEPAPSRRDVADQRSDVLIIGLDEAVAIAQQHGSGLLREIELEWDGEQLIYEIEIGTTTMLLDARHGTLLSLAECVKADSPDGRIDIERSESAITMQQAVTAAQAAVDGVVHEVEFGVDQDGPIYSVDIRHQKVIVSATSGAVIAVVVDD